ncbi:TERF1-interacting nuclear factor 2 isoform X2 [Pleurodeles waltl]|uniref:TERF1-interacting nuclear factor 2 isoform X2 n=1 Tax=Pleurodeles waltl TaxID=8319 RepID=UPI00370987AF
MHFRFNSEWLLATERGKQKMSGGRLMETQEILLEHVSPQQLAAAASWHVVRCRQFSHFTHVLEFLEMMNAAAPDLVAYRHFAKLTLGLKASIVVDMIRQYHSRSSIFLLVNRFFPDSYPAMHPHATQRDYTKISEVVKAFRDTLRRLPIDQRNWTQYIKAELEEEYGEVFLAALEKLLREYFMHLESTMSRPNIQQFQESMMSTGRSRRSKKKDLCSSLRILQRYFLDMGWSQCDRGSLRMEMEPLTASKIPLRRLRQSDPQHLESSLGVASETSGKRFCPRGGRSEGEVLGYHSKRMQHNKYTTVDEKFLNCAFEMLPASMPSPIKTYSPVRLSPLKNQRFYTPRKISQVHKVQPNPSVFSCSPGRHSPKQQKLELHVNKHVKIFSTSKTASLPPAPSKSNVGTMELKVSLVKLPFHNSQKTVLLSHVDSESKPVSLPPVDSNGKALTMDLRVSLVRLSLPDFQKNVPLNLSETNIDSQKPECPSEETVSQFLTDSQEKTVYSSPGSPLQKPDPQNVCNPPMMSSMSPDGCKEKTHCMAIECLSALWDLHERKGCPREHEKEEDSTVFTPAINNRQYLSSLDKQSTPVLCSSSIISVLASEGEGAVQLMDRLRPTLSSPMLKRRRLFSPEEVAGLILEEPAKMGSKEEQPLVSNTKCNNEHTVKYGLQDTYQLTGPFIVQSDVLSHDCKEDTGMWSASAKSSSNTCPLDSRKRARSPESLRFPMPQLSPVGKRRDCNKVLSIEMKNWPPDSLVSTRAAPKQYNISNAEPAAVESSKPIATETSGLKSDSDFLVASRPKTDPAAEQKENILLHPLCSGEVIPQKTSCCESYADGCVSSLTLFPRPPKSDTEVIMDSEDEESGGSNKISLQNYHKTKFNTYIPTFREHFRRTFRCAKKQVVKSPSLRLGYSGSSHEMSKRKTHVSKGTRLENKPVFCISSGQSNDAVMSKASTLLPPD